MNMISKSKEGNKRERRTESQPYQNETSSPVKPNAENKKMSKYTSSNSKNLMRSMNASNDAAQGKRNYESGFAVLQKTGDSNSQN